MSHAGGRASAKFTSSLETALDATRKLGNKPQNRSVSGFRLISQYKSLKIHERIIVARLGHNAKKKRNCQMLVRLIGECANACCSVLASEF